MFCIFKKDNILTYYLLSISFFTLFLFLFCSNINAKSNKNNNQDLPEWYVTPKSNNAKKLYGVAEGVNLEDATQAALVDLSARLLTTISSETNSIAEENKYSVNEEIRKNVKQNIEKIEFTDYKITESKQVEGKFYIQLEVNRSKFVKQQNEKITFLEQQIADYESSMNSEENKNNPIKRASNLKKILDNYSQVEILTKIIIGAGEDVDMSSKLTNIAKYRKQLENINDLSEFFIEQDISSQNLSNIKKIITKSLNKNGFKIATNRNKNNQNQILIKIEADYDSNFIYENHMVKVKIQFNNYLGNNISASNNIELSGASTISEKQAVESAIASLNDKIANDTILKIIGIN